MEAKDITGAELTENLCARPKIEYHTPRSFKGVTAGMAFNTNLCKLFCDITLSLGHHYSFLLTDFNIFFYIYFYFY